MSNISNRRNLPEQKALRQALRNNATSAEACLWKSLKSKQVDGLKFRRQYGFGPYVLDFYCPEIRLCIELDGEIHKSSGVDKHDEIRTVFLKNNNVHVIRFDNEVVFKNTIGIIEKIKRYHNNWKNDSRGLESSTIDQTTPNPSYSGGEYNTNSINVPRET